MKAGQSHPFKRRSLPSCQVGRFGNGLRFFTMLEMVATVIVMVILLALAAPAIDQAMRGSGVTIAAREMGTQVYLARQYALANRRYTAVVMPGKNAAAAGVDPRYAYSSHRIAFVAKDGSDWEFDEWVEASQWRYLRTGVCILEADSDIGVQTLSGTTLAPALTPNDDLYGKLQHVDLSGIGGSVDTNNVRCIILSPAGRVKGDTRFITVGDVTFQGFGGVSNDPQWVIRNPEPAGNSSTNESARNQVTIEVNRFTGGTSFWQPNEY